MKKVLYSLAIMALSLSAFSCGSSDDEKNASAKPAEVGKVEAQKVEVGKPVTMETTTRKMNALIEYPGAITITDTNATKTILSKLTPAQGENTYNCAVLFTGTSKKGKIWNITPKTIKVAVEWKYENDETSLDTVEVESQKHKFTHADASKGATKTITYNVIE